MVPLFRAPYGEIHPTILQWAEEIGYQHIGWTRLGKKGTLDTLDWVSDPEDPLYLPGSATVKKILTQLKDPAFRGGIILMHLGVERKEDRVQDYLPELIDGIRGLSLPILPVSELLLFSP
jgi:peptidoglycan/xylan/chitin deacetylase (PgdA/CDA1 family)